MTPHAVFEDADSPHYPYVGRKSYGLGQFIYDYRGHRVVDHYGAVPGQMSRVLRVMEKGLGIVVMANDNEYGLRFTEIVQYMILDHVLGLKALDWKAR